MVSPNHVASNDDSQPCVEHASELRRPLCHLVSDLSCIWCTHDLKLYFTSFKSSCPRPRALGSRLQSQITVACIRVSGPLNPSPTSPVATMVQCRCSGPLPASAGGSTGAYYNSSSPVGTCYQHTPWRQEQNEARYAAQYKAPQPGRSTLSTAVCPSTSVSSLDTEAAVPGYDPTACVQPAVGQQYCGEPRAAARMDFIPGQDIQQLLADHSPEAADLICNDADLLAAAKAMPQSQLRCCLDEGIQFLLDVLLEQCSQSRLQQCGCQQYGGLQHNSIAASTHSSSGSSSSSSSGGSSSLGTSSSKAGHRPHTASKQQRPQRSRPVVNATGLKQPDSAHTDAGWSWGICALLLLVVISATACASPGSSDGSVTQTPTLGGGNAGLPVLAAARAVSDPDLMHCFVQDSLLHAMWLPKPYSRPQLQQPGCQQSGVLQQSSPTETRISSTNSIDNSSHRSSKAGYGPRTVPNQQGPGHNTHIVSAPGPGGLTQHPLLLAGPGAALGICVPSFCWWSLALLPMCCGEAAMVALPC